MEAFRLSGRDNPAKFYSRAMAIYNQYLFFTSLYRIYSIFFFSLIYYWYLCTKSEKEINVDHESRDSVAKKLQIGVFDNEVFDLLQESVFSLLASDCFSKFCVTPEYKSWKKQAKRKKYTSLLLGGPEAPVYLHAHAHHTRSQSAEYASSSSREGVCSYHNTSLYQN